MTQEEGTRTGPPMEAARPWSILRGAAWGWSAVAVLLVAAASVGRSVNFIAELLADPPRPYGLGGLAFIAVYLAAAGALVVLAWHAARWRGLWRGVLPLSIVVVAIVVRAALAAVADGAPFGEPAIVEQQARGVLDGVCCFSHRPLGYPIALAGAYALLGPGPSAVEILNIGFAAATTWLTWSIGVAGWSRRVGALAATAYAVAPSQVLLALTPLTEPMFTLALAAAIRLALVLDRRALLAAAGAAVALAGGQYVRATSAVLVLPAVLAALFAGWGLRRAAVRGALLVGVFVVLLVPVILFNLRAHDELSISTSAYGGWSVYVGMNAESGGQWNSLDAAALAGFPGDSWWDRSAHAGSLALDRALEDPGRTLGLLPTKFVTLWGDEAYAADYAFGRVQQPRVIAVALGLSQAVWVVVCVLAAVGVVVDRRRGRPATLVLGTTVAVIALIHLLLEVHSRYHSYLLPLLCVLAAAGGAWLVERRAETAQA